MKINFIANVKETLVGLSYTSEKVITIGSEAGNTFSPLSVEGLSRRHAKIFEKDGKWMLEDLGSTNGTYRQGEKIEGAVELNVRDVLQLGKLKVTVDEIAADGVASAEASAKAPETAPAAATAPAPTAAAPAAPATAVLRRPALPTLKSGVKLPPKPVLGAGVKLPSKPAAPAQDASSPALSPVSPLTPVGE